MLPTWQEWIDGFPAKRLPNEELERDGIFMEEQPGGNEKEIEVKAQEGSEITQGKGNLLFWCWKWGVNTISQLTGSISVWDTSNFLPASAFIKLIQHSLENFYIF